MSYNHLDEAAIAWLSLPPEERVRVAWSSIWLGYPKAQQIHEQLERVLASPTSSRPECVLIWGESDTGKSMIVKEFKRQHPPDLSPELDAAFFPVMLVDGPRNADARLFWAAILEAFGVAFRPTEQLPNLELQAVRLLRACKVKLLIVDELHNILPGRRMNQESFLVLLKDLSNKLSLNLVAVTTDTGRTALVQDRQLESRFVTRMRLTNWALDREFQSLLASFERLIPLPEPSELKSPAMTTQIWGMTSGIIGEVARLLQRATELAVMSNRGKITPELLEAAKSQFES